MKVYYLLKNVQTLIYVILNLRDFYRSHVVTGIRKFCHVYNISWAKTICFKFGKFYM